MSEPSPQTPAKNWPLITHSPFLGSICSSMIHLLSSVAIAPAGCEDEDYNCQHHNSLGGSCSPCHDGHDNDNSIIHCRRCLLPPCMARAPPIRVGSISISPRQTTMTTMLAMTSSSSPTSTLSPTTLYADGTGTTTSLLDDKTEVHEYFNNKGFNWWNKIYSNSDEVNTVQLDIRKGHDMTIQKKIDWMNKDGDSSIDGKTVCDCGCGVGSLAIPLTLMGECCFAVEWLLFPFGNRNTYTWTTLHIFLLFLLLCVMMLSMMFYSQQSSPSPVIKFLHHSGAKISASDISLPPWPMRLPNVPSHRGLRLLLHLWPWKCYRLI